MSSFPVIVFVSAGTPPLFSFTPAYTGLQLFALHTAKLCTAPSDASVAVTVITGSVNAERSTLKSASKLL